MKKKLLFTLIAPMMVLSIQGCGSNVGMKLTYGTYITTEDDKNCDAREIKYSDLSLRMSEGSGYRNENFLLTIAPTNGCLCWAKFQAVLKSFISDTHYLVYQIKCTELDGKDSFGLNYQEGHVTFAIIKGGTVLKQYLANDVLESKEALKAEVDKFVRAPELYFVEQDYLNDAIKYGETALVEYMKSSCGDCNYVDPNILWPYVHLNSLTTKMYVIDLDKLVLEGESDYQAFKNNHRLSNVFSEEYGYETGFVPTFQYYERGTLKSASVFFNDFVAKVGEEFKVVNSFYSDERLRHLDYAKSVKTNVLKGLTLQEDDVLAYAGEYYWKQDKAAVYHKPLLEAFLKTYTK